MRAVIISVVVGSACGTVLLVARWPPAAPAESKKTAGVSLSKHNLGTVVAGDISEKCFTFRNSSAVAMRVIKTHASCRCVATKVSARSIAPGGSGTFCVKLNTRGMKDGERVIKHIGFECDPPTESFSILLEATACSAVVANPSTIRFSDHNNSAVVELSSTILTPEQVRCMKIVAPAYYSIGPVTPTKRGLQVTVSAEWKGPRTFWMPIEIEVAYKGRALRVPIPVESEQARLEAYPSAYLVKLGTEAMDAQALKSSSRREVELRFLESGNCEVVDVAVESSVDTLGCVAAKMIGPRRFEAFVIQRPDKEFVKTYIVIKYRLDGETCALRVPAIIISRTRAPRIDAQSCDLSAGVR